MLLHVFFESLSQRPIRNNKIACDPSLMLWRSSQKIQTLVVTSYFPVPKNAIHFKLKLALAVRNCVRSSGHRLTYLERLRFVQGCMRNINDGVQTNVARKTETFAFFPISSKIKKGPNRFLPCLSDDWTFETESLNNDQFS